MVLVRESGFRRWPPRLPEQPIFYLVCNEEYAIQIARDWNAPQSGIGYVTRFQVRREFMERYPVQTVGAGTHTEWWIPAEDLNALNENIVGFDRSDRRISKEKRTSGWRERRMSAAVAIGYHWSGVPQPGRWAKAAIPGHGSFET
jgi:hypothetical protein